MFVDNNDVDDDDDDNQTIYANLCKWAALRHNYILDAPRTASHRRRAAFQCCVFHSGPTRSASLNMTQLDA